MGGTSGWSATNYPGTAAAATVSQAALTDAAASNQTVRCRALTFTLSGAAATATGIIEFVVRNGATGAGTIIYAATLSAPAGGCAVLALSGLDLRATPGNALTFETTGAPATGCQAAVAANGDYVTYGRDYFTTF